MAIDTMSFVNIIGTVSNLDETLLRIVKCEMFHPENVDEKSKIDGFNDLNEQNPYTNQQEYKYLFHQLFLLQ